MKKMADNRNWVVVVFPGFRHRDENIAEIPADSIETAETAANRFDSTVISRGTYFADRFFDFKC